MRGFRGVLRSGARVLSNLSFRCRRWFEPETLVVVLDEKNPHIQNIRDGSTIKLDVNDGVYTIDVWICTDETGRFFSWQGQ